MTDTTKNKTVIARITTAQQEKLRKEYHSKGMTFSEWLCYIIDNIRGTK